MITSRARRVLGSALLLWAAALSGAAAVQAQPSAADGQDIAARLTHAAYRIPGAPSVIVHAPAGFDPHAPLQLVVFLHGYSGCVNVLMGRGEVACKPGEAPREGWDLGRYHDAAHTNTLFVVPQLAYMKRDGRPGAFAQPGGFRAFLEELLAGPLAPLLGGPRKLKDVARIDLVAHSAGYQTAIAIMEDGGLPAKLLASVVLFDALYGETPRYAQYVEQHARKGLRFVDISLAHGIPERESRVLAAELRQTLGPAQVFTCDAAGIAQAVALHPIVFAQGKPPHRLVPATHLAEVLAALHRAAAH